MDIGATLELLKINETIGIQFVLAAILLLVLTKFVFSPLGELIERRYQLTHGASDESKTLRQKYEEGLEKLNKELTDARRSAAEIVRVAEAAAKKEHANEIAEFQKTNTTKTQENRKILAEETVVARDKVRAELLDLKKELVDKIVGGESA